MKFAWLFITLFYCLLGNAQTKTVFIRVISSQDQTPIHLAKIQDYSNTAIQKRTGTTGFATWHILSDSVIISAWNFGTTTHFIPREQDTLFVPLIAQPEVLNEALVKPENSWLHNRIYAFERWESGWIFLSRKTLRVTDNKLDLVFKIEDVKIGNEIPTDLFVDALNNLFLVAKDSTQQLFITDTMAYRYPAIAITLFNELIKPVKLVTNLGIVYRASKPRVMSLDPFFANVLINFYDFDLKHPPLHNCGALFYLQSKKKNTYIYSGIDTPKFRSAAAAWEKYVSAYVGFWLKFDATGMFDTGLQRLYGQNLHTYNTLHAHYRETYWIPVNKNYIVLDPYADQMVLFDQDFHLISTQSMSFDDCPKEDYFTIDTKTNEWWLIREDRKLQILYPIRPNTKKQPLHLDAFITNLRTHDNRAFYIDQYGSFRIKKIP